MASSPAFGLIAVSGIKVAKSGKMLGIRAKLSWLGSAVTPVVISFAWKIGDIASALKTV